MIDINYCYLDDNPRNIKDFDPDKGSKKLSDAHNELWSRITPSGFKLEFVSKPFNEHTFIDSNGIKHILTSDCIAASGLEYNRYADYKAELGDDYFSNYLRLSRTIGAHILFPGKFENGCKNTINRARGCSPYINDRFDLTLECIKRFYEGNNGFNPLIDVLNATKYFYDLFVDFKGFIDFFLLQDFVDENYKIKFFLPFKNEFRIQNNKLSLNEIKILTDKTNELTLMRNERISNFILEGKY